MSSKELLQVSKQEFFNKLLLFYSSNQVLDSYFLKKYQHVELLSVEGDQICTRSVVPSGEVLFSFKVSGARYLFSAKANGDKFQIDNDRYYRVEKRKGERFLTYPHRKIYLSFPISIEDEQSNVITFNKDVNRNKKQILILLKSQESKEVERVSFRVFDFSETGCTFIANEEEQKYLESLKSFSGARIEAESGDGFLVSGKFSYFIDYLDQKFVNIKMKKIGVNFENEIDRESFLEIFNFVGEEICMKEVGLNYELFLSHLS